LNLINKILNITFQDTMARRQDSQSSSSFETDSDNYEEDGNALQSVINGVASQLNLGLRMNSTNADPSRTTNTGQTSNKSDYSSSDGSSDDSSISDDANDKNKPYHKSSKGNESAEDYSDDEDEGEDGYKVGGYHRVKVGEVYNQRYVVIKKLGWGHFSTVWMVKDRQLTKRGGAQTGTFDSLFYAIKVQKSAEHYTEAAMDEVELLDCVAKERKRCEASYKKLSGAKDKDGMTISSVVDNSRHVATLHDSFFHNGPHGRHMCMVFSMLGCNLLSVIKAYNYRGVPIPAVKMMMKGISKGLDFLHRKCLIIHTDLKPENILLQFPGQINAENGIDFPNNNNNNSKNNDNNGDNNEQVTIKELEAALQNPKTPVEERKKIRRKLKKRRQREKRRFGNDTSDEENDGVHEFQQALSDDAMERISNQTNGGPTKNAHERVLSRLSHSQFVMSNFTPRISLDGEFTHVINDMVKVSRPSKSELNAHFQLCSGQVGNRQRTGSGVAEVSFILRAFIPEGEIADNVSAALSGIPWELGEEKTSTREWRCGLSVAQPGQTSIATIFKLEQHGRKDLDDRLSKSWTHLSELVGENLAGRDATISSLTPSRSFDKSARNSQFSLFTVKFSVLSTMVVLGYLENRLPGLTFFNYKRDEGSPPIDHVIFGPFSQKICKHPLSMKIKDVTFRGENENPSCSNSLASAIFGFDLRMVKEFNARPTADGNGESTFQLFGSSSEKVASWWQARQPIEDRVKYFMGLDPQSDLLEMPLFNAAARTPLKQSSHKVSDNYMEGGKNLNNTNLSHVPRQKTRNPMDIPISDAQASVARATQQPDLRDAEFLKRSRAVVVDLGNACWTHRHFSEDIQTRQYRAPEVLLGHKYDTSADMWSLGCICFELLTGDLLFDPREGSNYDRDEDHLAMFQELLGKIPKKIAVNGKYSKNYFDRKGNLKHIKQLKFWPVEDVLSEKYHFSSKEAEEIASFVVPLLEYDMKERATALDCLRHKWLKDVD